MKELAIVEELLVKLLLMFIFAMLLEVVALLVIVLTMLQVVLGLLVDFSSSLSKYIFFFLLLYRGVKIIRLRTKNVLVTSFMC